jgi:hypothetical protein
MDVLNEAMISSKLETGLPFEDRPAPSKIRAVTPPVADDTGGKSKPILGVSTMAVWDPALDGKCPV